jgi:hypothetical protein
MARATQRSGSPEKSLGAPAGAHQLPTVRLNTGEPRLVHRRPENRAQRRKIWVGCRSALAARPAGFCVFRGPSRAIRRECLQHIVESRRG